MKDVNLKNKDVLFNQRSLNAMKASSDNDVSEFLADYSQILEEMAGSGNGEILGYINPIIRDESKTPMPCAISWSNAQRYEVVDDVKQCVKKRISNIAK